MLLFGAAPLLAAVLAASLVPAPRASRVAPVEHCARSNHRATHSFTATKEMGAAQSAGSTDWTYAWAMTQPDAPVADLFARTALASWKQNLDRLDRVFAAASDDQLQQEVAPGKNRLFYLLGHLVAVHDRMLPLLRLGARLHPELDEPFLTKADRTAPDTITPASLRAAWTEVNSALTSAMESLPAAAWLERHDAISAEDFDREPLRNRLSVLLSRGGHVQFHTGQIRLIIKQG